MEQYVASHLKTMNRQVIYKYIMRKQVTSRVEIERATGISAPTVIKAVEFLIRAGLVRNLGESQTTAVGRRPQLISVNDKAFYAVCFLLEGEFLSMGVVDSTRQIVLLKTVKACSTLDQSWQLISDRYIDELMQEAGVPIGKLAGIGIALPTMLDPESGTAGVSPLVGVLEPFNIREWEKALQMKYSVPVFLENDANACCIGERELRREEEIHDMIFISVGTGIGAGILLGDRLLRGKAGEIGVSRIDYTQKKPCTLEEYAGYDAVLNHFRQTSFDGMSEKMYDAVADYIAKPVATAAYNASLLLGCENLVIGGTVARMLGNGFYARVNLELLLMGASLTAQKPRCEEDGLIGLAHEVIEGRIRNILTEEQNGSWEQPEENGR